MQWQEEAKHSAAKIWATRMVEQRKNITVGNFVPGIRGHFIVFKILCMNDHKNETSHNYSNSCFKSSHLLVVELYLWDTTQSVSENSSESDWTAAWLTQPTMGYLDQLQMGRSEPMQTACKMLTRVCAGSLHTARHKNSKHHAFCSSLVQNTSFCSKVLFHFKSSFTFITSCKPLSNEGHNGYFNLKKVPGGCSLLTCDLAILFNH